MVSEFTGNETTYSLQQSSQFAVSGTITFKERKDGKVAASIQLCGTEGEVKHPIHLHLGNIAQPGANVALLMVHVAGKTGKSVTIFSTLADESSVDYQRLIYLQACIKIHLGDTGSDRDVILASGNIGSALATASSGAADWAWPSARANSSAELIVILPFCVNPHHRLSALRMT